MTAHEEQRSFPRMMIMITHAEDEKKLEKVLTALNIPVLHQCRGQGTAPSEIMDIFGLSGTARLITVVILPKCRVKEVFDRLGQKMAFRRKGGGVAVTLPVTGLQNSMLRMLNREIEERIPKELEGDEAQMREKSAYSVIWVSVSGGYSDDVVDAARKAGARGGTVIKGRRRGSADAARYLGLSMQEEQEFVMIIVRNERKTEVMTAISKACGIKTDAHGVVVSLPVDDVMGLTE